MYNKAGVEDGDETVEVLSGGNPHLVNHTKQSISQKVGNEWHVIKTDFGAFVEKHLGKKKEEEPVAEPEVAVKEEKKATKS